MLGLQMVFQNVKYRSRTADRHLSSPDKILGILPQSNDTAVQGRLKNNVFPTIKGALTWSVFFFKVIICLSEKSNSDYYSFFLHV